MQTQTRHSQFTAVACREGGEREREVQGGEACRRRSLLCEFRSVAGDPGNVERGFVVPRRADELGQECSKHRYARRVRVERNLALRHDRLWEREDSHLRPLRKELALRLVARRVVETYGVIRLL